MLQTPYPINCYLVIISKNHALLDLICMTTEEVVDLVKAFEVGKPDSLVVVIPKVIRDRMHIEKGTRFYMKVDRRGRLIYEPMRVPKQSEAEHDE